MASYSAPLRDMRFVYHELFDSSDISALPGFEEATRALYAGDGASSREETRDIPEEIRDFN